MTHIHQAQHADPVWRDRSNFIIASAVEPFGPGVESEQLWARQVGDFDFELCCIPFHTYGLALGDVVRTNEDFLVKDRLRQSGRVVFRAIFGQQEHRTAEAVTQKLIERGAQVEWYTAIYVAIDARDAEHAEELEAVLAEQQEAHNLKYERGN